jgi:hypothetical protein
MAFLYSITFSPSMGTLGNALALPPVAKIIFFAS